MKFAMVYLLVSSLTHSPLLAGAALLAFWLAGGSWWVGRLPDLFGPWRRWQQERALRDLLATNPHDLNARTDLAGLVAERNPAEAKELLGEVLRRYPEQALPHYWLGVACLRSGDLAGGQAAIDAALERRRDLRWGEPGLVLGDAYAAAGRHAEAIRAYERALHVHGSYAEVWFKAGQAAKAGGDAARARHFWQSTLRTTQGAPPFKRRKDRLWRWRAWWALRAW